MLTLKETDYVHAYVDAFNRGDVDTVCGCFAPGALVYGVLGWGDVPSVRPIWEQLVHCFAINLHVESLVSEGPTIAVRYTERGRFIRAFRGHAATQRTYEVTAMEWFEIGSLGITRRWGARDSATIFRQLGLPPG